MTNRCIPELLAPAGGFPQLRAAVLNGADAVYMGGSMFNARMRADNFGDDDMKAAVEYAHLRNVKLYVTLNTLIRDDELFKAFSYGCRLYEMGVDGLIIQDLGLGRLLHKFLPDMPLHLSTQATVYNPQAIPQVKALGYERVVPARELTMEELRAFVRECHSGEDPIEVEVFCHGALCMCYSGQCQLSRLMGGASERSGNRGLCAQPCRLPYTNDKGQRGYFLSPKDLCTLDLLPELCRAGVDSLKIEGRLKSPEYVAIVTSIYRKYLDQYRDTGRVSIDPADMKDLKQIFNRGGFTHGYLEGNPGAELLSGDSPKNQGLYVGEVARGNKSGVLVDVKLARGEDIAMGDGIEIRNPDPLISDVGNVVTYRKELGSHSLRIGDIKRSVGRNDAVYKVTSRDLFERARGSFADDDGRKVSAELAFYGFEGKVPVLRMKCDGLEVSAEGSGAVEAAVKRETTEVDVTAQLSKLGGTVYDADVKVKMDAGVAIPKSVLNGLRREVVSAMDEARRKVMREAVSPEVFFDVKDEIERASAGVPGEEVPGDVTRLPAVTKGRMDEWIGSHLEELECVMVQNLGWIKELKAAGAKLYAGPGLNVYNVETSLALSELGVRPMRMSWETWEENDPEIPLMVTEHDPDTVYLVDRKGVRYDVLANEAEDKYELHIAPEMVGTKFE